MIRDKSSCHPYLVKLHINGHPLTMEVDTGAGVSLAPESMVASLLPSTQLQKTNTVLRSYTGQPIPVKGTISVTVGYGQHRYENLKLLVVEGSGPSLMGRDYQYPLPKPEDIFATLSGGQKFTTLDLSHAYNQLLLDDDARKYVTINTPKGLYQYTRLPFGIASAPAIFQRTMDSILQGIDGVACYIDDIVITGKDDEEHLARLEKVLRHLLRHGVHVKLAKCKFLQPSVNFLGHRVDADGIHTTDEKLKTIVEAPAPKNIATVFLRIDQLLGQVHPERCYYSQPAQQPTTQGCKVEVVEGLSEGFSPRQGKAYLFKSSDSLQPCFANQNGSRCFCIWHRSRDCSYSP